MNMAMAKLVNIITTIKWKASNKKPRRVTRYDILKQDSAYSTTASSKSSSGHTITRDISSI
ncbi:hypothetical protein KAFR_0G03675 [Kazachstania africana CBS 2517]|uniref:Uncharacterized protein n=1 Tax=Kazachstania africana (strain ATCC 22294 / BCRC 22015 / CBS 2517 / CECT 1963 / NBRC 1671 / NRRL Y-8276) TaxID=1071382 RepID=H2AYF0_KAZAF|nr:hypothetical protein KAFR_0G03675 [Kazachstania africana CBS 2517]CCF59400.1 hypothetical protein KAFR_0G03675 [Kazachstania africana CBS 2517]